MEANSTQNGGGGGGGPASQPQLDDRKAAAQKLFDHYARLQEALRLNFERDLAKATGINSSAEADSENDPHHADKGSNKTHQHGAGAAMQINHVTGFLDAEDDSDSEESEDVEMPSPADPEHPGKPRKISVPSNGAKSLGRKKKVDNNEATALTKTIYAALELMKEKSGGAIAEGRKPTKPKTLGKHTRGGRSLPHILRRDSGPFGQMQLMDDAGEEAESGEEHGEDGGPVSKKPRIRASKIEFKRLDALYNKNIHDFYLAESNKTPEGKSDKWEEYLFIVRRQFDWQNKFQKVLVDIKSAEITGVLRDVMKNVKGVNLRDNKPTIEPNLLYIYLPDMEEVLEAEKKLPEESQNKLKIQHLSILVDYINTDYAPIRKVQYPLIAHSEITFELLWSLFVPNTLLYTICEGSNEPRCLKLDLGMEKEDPQRGKYFSLDCRYVDYDGKTFGQARAFLEISDFVGTRRIDNLPVFPLAYHDDEESIRDKLIARGRKFGEMKGMHYKYYKGLAFVKKKRELVRVNVQSRIMVDPLTFRRINPNYSVSPVKPGGGVCSATGDPFDEEDSDIGEFGEHDETSIPGGTVVEGARIVQSTPALSALERTLSALEGRPGRGYKLSENRMRLVRTGWDGISPKPVAKSKESMVPEEMSEEELLICSPTVLGFSFGDKLWVEFAVEHIREIVFNTGAFDSLVLPENQKTIVRALVESQNGKTGDKRPGIGDIIQNKGKGMVAVLHGRPGVGKTLTAEGISEYLKRPLYMVSAGELGTDARTLELQLSKILQVAHGWGAILLIDEADVFLERRSVHDLQRNGLVSIFLRLLEYFQGILFLTTNRVETFDEAFQSRIHIALRYNDLDRKAKRIIWKTFLDMVSLEEATIATTPTTTREIVSGSELDGLARRDLNGRQIKNVVRTSQALAYSLGEDLAMKHLVMVLEVTEEFEHDLKGTGQIDGMMSYA